MNPATKLQMELQGDVNEMELSLVERRGPALRTYRQSRHLRNHRRRV